MEAFGVLEISRLSEGYQVLNDLTSQFQFTILEANPISSKNFLIVFQGDRLKVRQCLEHYKNPQVLARTFLESLDKEIRDAIYGLSKVELNEGLLVFEAPTFSLAVTYTHHLAKKYPLKVIECRPGRLLGGKSLCFLTGKNEDLKLAFESLSQGLDFSILSQETLLFSQLPFDPSGATWIPAPTKDFRQYFNLSGKI